MKKFLLVMAIVLCVVILLGSFCTFVVVFFEGYLAGSTYAANRFPPEEHAPPDMLWPASDWWEKGFQTGYMQVAVNHATAKPIPSR